MTDHSHKSFVRYTFHVFIFDAAPESRFNSFSVASDTNRVSNERARADLYGCDSQKRKRDSFAESF